MHHTSRPLVRVAMFLRGRRCYAFFDLDPDGDDLSLADWESQDLERGLRRGSARWHQGSFAACLAAFRRLQARHPDKDLVLTADQLPVGELPLFGRHANGGARSLPDEQP